MDGQTASENKDIERVEPEPTKWYNSQLASNFSEYLGIGLGVGLAALLFFRGYASMYVDESDAETEMQRLRTVQTLAEKYGDEMEPNQFKEFVKDLIE